MSTESNKTDNKNCGCDNDHNCQLVDNCKLVGVSVAKEEIKPFDVASALSGINDLAQHIHEGNVKRGFWEDAETKNKAEVLMLCVSELSEALEADRKGRWADMDLFRLMSVPDVMNGDNTDGKGLFKAAFQGSVKDTFEDEIADTMIRLLDLCNAFNIDIAKHIELKLKYNSLRPYKHGKKY